MKETSLAEIGEKVKSRLSWDKIADNLPIIATIALGLFVLDKSIDIGGKVKILTEGSKRLNQAEFFEGVDTVGDQIQLFDSILKCFDINLGEFDLKRIGDFFQNLGTSGKYIKQLTDIFKDKFGGSFSGSSGSSGSRKI